MIDYYHINHDYIDSNNKNYWNMTSLDQELKFLILNR